MLNFDTVFNVVFLTIFIYHVFYFMAQYVVIRRVEFFYYSLFLLSAATYYFVFHSSLILFAPFRAGMVTLFAPLELSFAFIQNFFYISFIVAYLDLNKAKLQIYTLLKYYKYYNLVFIFVFPLLYAIGFSSQSLYGFISALTLPITFTLLFMLWRLNTSYSNVILYGTTCTVLGTAFSIYFMLSAEMVSVRSFVPVQIGLLLDLFILGYGLSLKAAETDRKLVVALQENQKLLEVERGRFARDLHDGLGGLLSSVKFSFSNMKDNIILTAQQGLSFEQSLHKLDSGIAELRRIAHNLMPENLQQFGLDVALKDFCLTIQQGTACKIHYESFGMNNYQAESTIDIAVYRMAQELVNNALKHAAASQVIVQLQKNEKHIILMVEDNGKGFSTAILKTEKGSGWKSIESRVNLLKGTLHINSNTKGTTINIEVPV